MSFSLHTHVREVFHSGKSRGLGRAVGLSRKELGLCAMQEESEDSHRPFAPYELCSDVCSAYRCPTLRVGSLNAPLFYK